MKLSACYIVKDAAAVLGKSLQSLKDSVDEIVVVDTGSVDTSIEIARQAGAKVYSYSWQDDFAAARNFALSKASGDWIVFLDADEYFSSETTENLRLTMKSRTKDKDVLLVKIINIDIEQQEKILDAFFAPRIFKHDIELYYIGKVHEQLMKNRRKVTSVAVVPEKELSLYHTGYSSSQIQVKAKRNLKLLLTELKKKDHQDRLYTYLAEAYDGSGDAVNAMYYAKLDIASGRQDITYASRSYRIVLRLLEQQYYLNDNEILQTLKGAIKNFPELPEFRAEYAQYLAQKFKYDEAIKQMNQALQCSENYSSMEPSIFDEGAQAMASRLIMDWQLAKQLQQSLKISACVITKNEEKEIGFWIKNMQVCTDEQILVDTGSTDNTVAIAEAAGVKVYHYVWDDNFAAAKNFALEKAKGDWIVFLDADETFTPETVENVRCVIAREHLRVKDVDAIFCPIINIDVDKNTIEINRFVNLRLFRNVSYLRYRGNVHEGVRHEGSELRILIEKNNLEIYHTGYSSSRINEKLRRNLKLLQEDIDKNGEGIQHYRYLMDCYQGLGDYEKAIKYAKLHLASNASSIGSESDIYRNLINSMVLLKRNPEKIEPYLKKAVERFSDIPDFYAYYAANFFRQGDFSSAKKYLLQALDVYQHVAGTSTNSSSFAYILSETYSYLGQVFLQENDKINAQYYIDLALKDNPYNCQAFQQLYALISGKSIEDIAKILAGYYGKGRQNLNFIIHCLEKEKIGKLYFYYADMMEKKYNIVSAKTKWYRVLAEGKAQKVYQEVLQQGTEKMQQLVCILLCMNTSELPKKAETVLPIAFWHCIQCYHGAIKHLDKSDSDGYMALLPAVIRFGHRKTLHQFVKIGQELSMLQGRIIFVLCEQRCWFEAEWLFDKAFIESALSTGADFRMAGICAYYCGNYAKAESYLNRAILESKEKDIRVYLSWIDEKIERLKK